MSEQLWIIENADGTIDGFLRLHDGKGKERTKEDALKVLCPYKKDLMQWAASGQRLRLGTRAEYIASIV